MRQRTTRGGGGECHAVDMKLGVMSDIHGNCVALDAVVADAAAVGVDAWWVLGDLVAIGPDPVGTLELIAALPQAAVIRGNTERYVLTLDRPPPYATDVEADPTLLDLFAAVQRSFAWTSGALASSGHLNWIADLPFDVRTELADGTQVLGVHSALGRDDGAGITPHRPDDELRADFESARADIVIGGHTHQPTDRYVDGVRALNGGSVSNPVTDDLRAAYLILHHDRHGHQVEHRRVRYDVDAFLQRLDRSGHPEADFIASFQRGEQIQHPAHRPGAPVVA